MKMKLTIALLAVLTYGCTSTSTKEKPVETPTEQEVSVPELTKESEKTETKTYSNARFRNVKVEKVDTHKYKVTGEAQVFEATLNWVVEDGHNELKEGFATADIGAPEWGSFDFEVKVEKVEENSTLTLMLFEISAEDGSRNHELPIPLY